MLRNTAGEPAVVARQLGDAKGTVQFGSVTKLKGIEMDAFLVTDAVVEVAE